MTVNRNTPIFRRLDEDGVSRRFEYERAFAKNIGLFTKDEQEELRTKCVAVAGSGGHGSLEAVILARQGVSHFVFADYSQFDFENISNQFGARCSTIGQNKVDVLCGEILDINPEAHIDVIRDPLVKKNIGPFLDGVDLVLDSLGFGGLDVRDILIPYAQREDIPVIVAMPIGFSCAMIVFSGDSMAYESYFDFLPEDTDLDRMRKFAIGMAPRSLHTSYMKVGCEEGRCFRGSLSAAGVGLSASMAGAEAIKVLLKKKQVVLAPQYMQFDLLNLRYCKGHLAGGNRHWLQRLKLWFRKKRKTSVDSA